VHVRAAIEEPNLRVVAAARPGRALGSSERSSMMSRVTDPCAPIAPRAFYREHVYLKPESPSKHQSK
jgi:hypothetical protein